MSQNSTYRLGLLEGDGIGHEIVPAARQVVDAAVGHAVTWEPLPMGRQAIEDDGAPLPQHALKALEALDGWMMGPHDSASYPEPHRSRLNPSGMVRKHFDLFANIRPARSFSGANGGSPRTDLVVVRENTQGFYADRNTFQGSGEWMPSPDVAIAQAVFTRPAIERIAVVALNLARRRRKHLTIVHKANVLVTTTGMFRDIVHELAVDYPDVRLDDYHIDAMSAHLVLRANEFDVIVTENMFGDILSDLAGAVAGSLGVAPSLNASHDAAMAQAAHGAAPDISGQGIANPVAMILSAAMFLDWLGDHRDDAELVRAATRIDAAVTATLEAGTATPDLGGQATTATFTEAVIERLSS
ncbi:MAG: isocitrate/isopropylmalate dehydrogenase family protein [Propionibacteriales bacterium]|nr:isocitrate/isopropylmalate dehydrogenase family protein [Propionibacteriales bacterium]